MVVELSIIPSVIALAIFVAGAFKEKHFVRRDVAVLNGLLLVGSGISLLLISPVITIFSLIPLAILPIAHGFLGIPLVIKRVKLGNDVLSSKACAGMLALMILFQFIL